MKNRKERLPVIIDLLTHKIIKNQEQLLQELQMLGFTVTQATLSRDLKQLKTSKVPNSSGGYRYVVSSLTEEELSTGTFNAQFPVRPIVHSIVRSGNIIIIKAPSSHAKLLANAFESFGDERIAGSMPIGDTVMLVIKPHLDMNSVYELLTSVMTVDLVAPYIPGLEAGVD